MLVHGRQQALHIVAHLASHPCEGRRAAMRPASEAWTGLGIAHPATPAKHSQGTGGHPAGCPVGIAPGGNAMGAPPAARPWPADQTRIVVEDPCDADAAAAMAGEGGTLVRVPVDADGLRTDHLPDGDAALIHVTPEHQRPLGSVLSRDRRFALLQWAARAGALILEEDIDGELRYGGMTAPSLMSLDRSERVILLGGFSVSLGPWLDIAYMVLPRWLVPFALAARRLIDDSRNSLEQAALADFLGGGGYARHVHRLTKAYAIRRDALLVALGRHLGGSGLVWGQQAGLHLAWFLRRTSARPCRWPRWPGTRDWRRPLCRTERPAVRRCCWGSACCRSGRSMLAWRASPGCCGRGPEIGEAEVALSAG